MDPSIVIATPQDLEGLDRLQREAFVNPWRIDVLRAAIFDLKFLVRLMREPQAGLIGFYVGHNTQGAHNLDNLVVEPSYRRQGFGLSLMQDWMARARLAGHSALTLQVNTRNLPAQNLYVKLGFRHTRRMLGYYPNGEDAFEMRKTLK